MSFHIAEIMSDTITLCSREHEGEMFNTDMDTSIEYTVSVGLHLEKSKPAMLVEGNDSYVFSWVESFVEKDGFGSEYVINLESECLLCNTAPTDDKLKDSPKGLMFYDSEVSVDTLNSKADSLSCNVDNFSEDTRIWTVSPPRLRMEDTISQCVCTLCEEKVVASFDSITADGIPPKLLVYIL